MEICVCVFFLIIKKLNQHKQNYDNHNMQNDSNKIVKIKTCEMI